MCASTPELVSRPAPKPPDPGDASAPSIEDLTKMRVGPWRQQLDKHPSYAVRYPRRAADIMEGITTGVRVGYLGERNKSQLYPRNSSSTEGVNEAKMQAIFDKDVARRHKAGPFDKPPFPFFIVSPLSAVPKPPGDGIRVVHNLSFPFGAGVNGGIPAEAITLDSVNKAMKYIRRLYDADKVARPGRSRHKKIWLIKLDVEAAFKQVPVCEADRPLLGMRWKGKYYYELVLPFGLRTSGNRWELYAAALHYFFKYHLGVELVIHYVDDFLLIFQSKREARRALSDVLALCQFLGVPMAKDKTFGPATCMIFLGIELDTELMEARLSAARLKELQGLLRVWDTSKPIRQDQLGTLIGKLSFAACVVRPGRTFMHRMYKLLAEMKASRNKGGRSALALRVLSEHAREDARWWQDFLPQWNGKSIILEEDWTEAADLDLYTDACEKGYGARCGDAWFQGLWSKQQLQASFVNSKGSMPYLELHALVHAASVWAPQWRGKRITFRCDAIAAVGAVQSMCSNKDNMADLLRMLHTLAATHGFDFRVAHIAAVALRRAEADVRAGHPDLVHARGASALVGGVSDLSAAHYMRSAVASSTRATYRSAVDNFRPWRDERKRPRDAPITANEVTAWAAQRADEGRLSAATLRVYKAALRTAWVEEAHPDGDQRNPCDSEQVSRVLAGIQRAEDERPVERRIPPTPLTMPTLQRFDYNIGAAEVMRRAAAMLGVAASLRSSELLGSARWPQRALRLNQLSFYSDLDCTKPAVRGGPVPLVMRVRLLVTKTEPRGCDKIVSVHVAVAAVWKWFLERWSCNGAKGSDRIFEMGSFVLTTANLVKDLQRRHNAVEPALPPARYTGKSLRRGGASTLAMQGIDGAAIASQGWAVGSEMWRRYANDPEAQLQRAIQINRLMQFQSPGTGAAAAAAPPPHIAQRQKKSGATTPRR